MDDVRRFVFVDERRSYAARTGQANSDMGWIRVLAYREQRPVKLFGFFDNREQKTKRQGGDSDWQSDRATAPDANGELLGDAPAKPEARSEAAPKAGEAPAPTMQRIDGSNEEKMMAQRDSKDSGGSFPGTGWGDRRTDHVQYVNFTAERNATDQIVFRYEYARGLLALGIDPRRDRLADRDGGGFIGFAKAPRR